MLTVHINFADNKVQPSITRKENRSGREIEKCTDIEEHYCGEKRDDELKEKTKKTMKCDQQNRGVGIK